MVNTIFPHRDINVSVLNAYHTRAFPLQSDERSDERSDEGSDERSAGLSDGMRNQKFDI